MTVLTSETQLSWGTTVTLPRVNLLPPEIAEKRAFRKIQICMGAAVLASVGVVGMLYLNASGNVQDGQSALSAAQSERTALQAETTKYNGVTGIYSQAAAAQAALTTAMGDEIRYSQMLNDLSLTIPDNVWLKSITYAGAPAGAIPAPGATAVPIATLTASGTAFTYNDVAVLLESLMGLKTYTNAYLSNSSEALIGTRKTVNYSITADVTKAAQSGRYTKPAGG